MSAPTITRAEADKIRQVLEQRGRRVPDALRRVTESPQGKSTGKAAGPPAGDTPTPRPRSAHARPAEAEAAKRDPELQRNLRAHNLPSDWTHREYADYERGRERAARARKFKAKTTQVGRGVKFATGYTGASRLVKRKLGGSDGGGLLLAFWLYPLALAVIQYGVRGPGMWLRAKFLNQDMSAAATAGSGAVSPATPAAPSAPSTTATAANPQPTYGGGGSTAMQTR